MPRAKTMDPETPEAVNLRSENHGSESSGKPEPDPVPDWDAVDGELGLEPAGPPADPAQQMVTMMAVPVALIGGAACAATRTDPLSAAEIDALARSVAQVAALYEIQVDNPHLLAWFGLVGALGAVAVPRFQQVQERKRAEAAKAKRPDAPAGPATSQPAPQAQYDPATGQGRL